MFNWLDDDLRDHVMTIAKGLTGLCQAVQSRSVENGESDMLRRFSADYLGSARVDEIAEKMADLRYGDAEPLEAGFAELRSAPSLAEQVESLLMAIPAGMKLNISIEQGPADTTDEEVY